MSWTPPTVAQFQAQFFRDFPYAPTGDASLKYVQPQDITNAINEANIDFNPSLFGGDAVTIFMYLAAYMLVDNIRNSSMGLGSLAKFPLENSNVGGVSINNSIVARFKDDANFAKYLTNGYGRKYLTLAYPYTIGGVGYLPGTDTYN